MWNDKFSCKTECLLWILCQKQSVRSVGSGWHFPALTCQAAYMYMYFLLSSRCSYKGRSPSSNWSRSLSVQLWHALWKKCVKTDVLSNLRGKYNTSINNTLYQYNKIHCHTPVVDIKYLLLSFVTTAKERCYTVSLNVLLMITQQMPTCVTFRCSNGTSVHGCVYVVWAVKMKIADILYLNLI